MGLIKLFKMLWRYRANRKNYRIKPVVKFYVDTHNYFFMLLPTIVVAPWTHRTPKVSVVDIMWLNFAISFGIWENAED